MLRVIPALTLSAILLMSACASNAPPDRVTASSRTKVVSTENRRKCATIIAPLNKANFCATPRDCPAITTCGEAYYRYTTCGEVDRDGGVAGKHNGIPCEKLCGKTALEMAEKIRSEPPFSPPAQMTTVCSLT
jgi:hypothetical protein